MNPRRALIVRSGEREFPAPSGSGIEYVEKVSHSIEAIEPPSSIFAEPVDLAIFTSRAAVGRVLGGTLAEAFARCASRARIVAVGAATAASLAAAGRPADLVAKGSAESILDALGPALAGVAVILPCGDDATALLQEGLSARGAIVRRAVVYRKRPNPREDSLEREILERPFAALCATSSAAARWLFEGLGVPAGERLRRTPALALGPPTRRTLEALGVRRVETATEPTFASAAHALDVLATESPGK